ncbi:small oligopeptide transporter [Melanomma pulvis-pyrius CBS 109.77]|uniref:Small oligopeptide transporter n=1 Tax=Melanomma pulvis-pyrius CBS 109.77 TaxID=1314802 RepID=A0A6A6XA66_9PLEO|nr:small oligopeptide transporter [Melanomma pulvis-pyrius CBS 109.77]
MDEKRSSKSSSVFSSESTPLASLQKRLTTWDLNLPDDSLYSIYSFDKYGASTLRDDDSIRKDDESIFKDPVPILAEIEGEDSPYAEVRAAVPNSDEDLPANTIRAWVLGLTLSFFGAAVNTIFSLRNPVIGIGVIVAQKLIHVQLIAYVLGNAWARFMPSKQHRNFGIDWNLNPGPFNVKEHAIIVVMANVSFGTAYATDIILAQKVFYKQDFGIAFQLLLTITTSSVGYGIAGFLRRFLVYPAAMIWPSNLVSVSLLHAMHEKEEDIDPTVWGGNMTRYKWFGVVFLASYLYYWIPGFFAQFLSIFVFITWIFPQNPIVNQVFGGTTGLGMLPLTLDWTTITGFTGNPMIPPWHAIANTLVGVVTFYIFGSLVVHYSGSWYAQYLPMSDSTTYDNTGAIYNVSRIVTTQLTLNEEAYKAYSPLFLSTTFSLSYGLSFATIASVVVYTYLNYRHVIISQFKNSKSEKPDIHQKLMEKYPEVPEWWYGILFVIMFALSLVTVLAYPTEFAWWAFIMSIAFATVMSLPIGIIQAITNLQIGLNVITEFIMGYMQPGKPLALMMFKTYGYITASSALGFVGDLKFGHYMKIPPRTMFTAQVVATTLSCFVQIAVLNFALGNIENICEIDQKQRFSCPGGRVFFSASVIWGLLGPGRIFSPGQIYSPLLWFFPAGIAATITIHYAAKKIRPLKYAMTPLIFGGGQSIPPASPMNYLAWGIVGWFFQKYVRTRNFRWWARLNYITAVGLDTGLAISTLTIFFIFTINRIDAPQWWGNTVISSTMDTTDTAIQVKLSTGQTVGPRAW